MGKLVTVIGNTAAGKTTLVETLAVAAPFVTGLEQHTERPFQRAFAQDRRFALANQIDYLLLRAEQEQAIRREPGIGLVDGGLDEDFFVFTRHFHAIGYLDAAEYALCERFYRYARSMQPLPDLFIYLDVPLDALAARFARRSRTLEIASVEQLAHLQRQVDAWVATIDPARLLVVDASKSFTPAVLACILARIHLACEIPFASTGLTFSTP
ncbi:deoxynucleoside kinase [Caldilinea sp.]|uniref:deoxynucleoside kinase n=1 Tax=Caldilinea sp. TaxID=2293560 RepID=UPI002CBE846F|nr:deoxynucleoside kinase [Anaerolineales bacterium]HQY94636.1 deoxynucleoside kinase [Caldilinea sp.]HRA64649.1 deoxynucleoside kinase [Caldilinea sp.]